MGDWPAVQEWNPAVIGTFSAESIGIELGCMASNSGTAAWLSADRAVFVPFCVYAPWTAKKITVDNGATVSGNIDVGIYDDQGNRLVSSGSTAHAGTNALQTFDITDTLLLPGWYYMAGSMDNNVGTVRRWTPNVVNSRGFGVLHQTSAFPLPATATFAALTTGYTPLLSVINRTVV